MDRLQRQVSSERFSALGAALIKEAVDKINRPESTHREIISAGLGLYKLIDELSESGTDTVVFSQLDKNRIKAAQQASLKFEITIDRDFMGRAMLGEVTKPSEHPLQKVYDRLGFYEDSEIKRCLGRDFRKPVVHIGSGYAETAIALHLQFNVPVICVEKDSDTSSKVKEVLKKFNLYGENKIQIMSLYGQQIAPTADAVIVSAMVPTEDKFRIIGNLRGIAYGNGGEPLLVLRTSSKPIFSLEYPVLLDDNKIADRELRKIGDTQPMLKHDDPIRSQIFEVLPTSSVMAGRDERPIWVRSLLQEV